MTEERTLSHAIFEVRSICKSIFLDILHIFVKYDSVHIYIWDTDFVEKKQINREKKLYVDRYKFIVILYEDHYLNDKTALEDQNDTKTKMLWAIS